MSTTPVEEDVGNGLPTDKQDTDGASGSSSIVWHGTDVVLISEEHLKAFGYDEDQHQQHTRSVAVAAVPKHRGNMSQSFIRRVSFRQESDYGWLRQLDLRNDVPCMDEILSWDFDVLLFEEKSLVQVFVKLLEYYDLLEKFNLDRGVLERYAVAVMNRHHKDCYYQKVDFECDDEDDEEQKGDPPSPSKPKLLCEYHNWYHAISCAHVCFLFLALGGADDYLNAEEIFSIIMGALIHDLDHPGTNNDFEVKRKTTLAEQYDNDAVLERHSINLGLNLCQENPELDWLGSFDNEESRKYIEHFMTECILATDPARHAGVVKEALSMVEKGAKDYQSTVDSLSEATSTNNLSYFDRNDPTHRQFIGRLLLHSADISNPLHSSFEVARDWAIRVTTEFAKQATKEKQLELPVTSFMDGLDSEYKISKLQIGFFNFMVKPLFHTVGVLLPKTRQLEYWGVKNCEEYQKVIDAYDLQHNISQCS